MPRPPLIVMSVLVCAALAGQARADSLAHAQAAYLNAEFQTAERAFESMLADRSIRRGDAAQAHRFLATLKAHTKRRARARFHVRAALALDPKMTPAPGSPNSVTALFRRYREEQGASAASIRLGWRNENGRREVVATAREIPKGLACGIRVRCSSGSFDAGTVGFLPEVSVPVPPQLKRVTCTADAVTAHGMGLLSTTTPSNKFAKAGSERR